MAEVKLDYAAEQVRLLGVQLADLYFEFVKELYEEFGDEKTEEIVTRVLFTRAKERALDMIARGEEKDLPRTPENIRNTSDVPYCGWVLALGKDHCPYGMAWNKHIEKYPWFRKYAALYCDVTDTTIGEVYTGDHSHKLHKNVVLGDESCEREYYPDENVKQGIYTYDPDRK